MPPGSTHGEPYLRRIARPATHLHWCHQWNTDFLYAEPEIDQIARWLDSTACACWTSTGRRGWRKSGSPPPTVRLAGVELVASRLEMTARLGGT